MYYYHYLTYLKAVADYRLPFVVAVVQAVVVVALNLNWNWDLYFALRYSSSWPLKYPKLSCSVAAALIAAVAAGPAAVAAGVHFVVAAAGALNDHHYRCCWPSNVVAAAYLLPIAFEIFVAAAAAAS